MRKHLIPVALAFAFLAFSFSEVNAGQPADERQTSVCEMARFGAKEHGRLIRFQAEYITDRTHVSGFKDRRCPKEYIDLDVPRAQDKEDPSVRAFHDAVSGDIDDPRLRRFQGDFSGVYISNPKDSRHGSVILLNVRSYKSLMVGPNPLAIESPKP